MVSKRSGKKSAQNKWSAIVDLFHGELPHLHGFFTSTEDFVELRLKAKSDGTILAIAKGYAGDGSPIVCFGLGYDVFTALLAIDRTINAGDWRTDKPYDERNK